MAETTWDGLPIAPDAPHGATVVVYRSTAAGPEFLLLHRAHDGPDHSGDWAWTAPAGARFPGEPVADCAVRELYEEAGLTLAMHQMSAEGAGWACYVAEAPYDVPVTLHDVEHDRYEWVSAAEALRRVSPEPPRQAIRWALDTIS